MSAPLTCAAALEPDMYRTWRRYVQEQCLLYERWPTVHYCWEAKGEVHEMYNPLTGRTLYGCMRCMRAHICQPEYGHVTCPRIVDAKGDEGAIICPFSGALIDTGDPVAVHNGSFEQRADILDRMRDAQRPRELAHEEADPMALINLHRGNSLAYAWHLRRGASEAKEARTSRTMYQQADEAEEHARRKPLIRAALRSVGHVRKSRRAQTTQENARRGREATAAELGLPGPLEWEGEVLGGDDDDMDPLEMPCQLPRIVLPPHDMDADDAYLSDVLRTLRARISNGPPLPPIAAAAEGASTTTTRKKKKKKKKKEAATDGDLRVPRDIAMPGNSGRGDRRRWNALSPYYDDKELVPHQRLLLRYVVRFVKHYTALAPQGTPQPVSLVRYAVFCDRLLWLYHRYAGDTAQQVAYWRGDHVDGLSHRLWPDGERTRRIFFTLLTRVLTGLMEARDKVTDAKIPVWLPDPFLTACWRARLFVALPPIGTELLGRTESPHSTPSLDRLRDDLLAVVHVATTAAAFSPHALHDFLHPETGRTLLPSDPPSL
jgi:hypothetical protein